ncbi:hypothetical protein AJ79_06055 [Helicocarpus griseus UAMH5409]|uniref:RRM domain-containing protein n=1 Tax=Helicocarpus griseus UAMH5409 TaxID=1447875 RepID=A0A2B7XH92_9EURO|nr:hypothetical protein AJ79_06055 [Helicocarpus griseus UAMH5409]
MAAEKKDKKRKAAVTSAQAQTDPPSKKSKKADSKPAKTQEEAPKSILKKTKATEATNGDSPKPVPVKVTSEPARQIRPRKRAADFLSDDEGEQEPKETKKKATASAAKKSTDKETEKPSKKSKKEAEVSAPAAPSAKKATATKAGSGKESSSAAKVGKKSKETAEPTKVAKQVEEDEDEGSGVEDEDDQTAALIQGFESSGDEDISGDEGFEPGKEVPAIPDAKQMKRKLRKMKKTSTETEEPGVVYVGRVPHGFYEHEMRAYFSQFGTINRLRLSRNRTTGKSKHFAFIEFASSSVAQVVADTMDNYLMFGHIMKCKFLPQESVHPELWKGANKRFKKTPWNAIERRRLDAGKTREQWSKKIEQEEARRVEKAEKMKKLGYEFEMPALKGVDEVPVAAEKEDQPMIDGAEQPAAIEAAPEADAKTTPKKTKKEKKDTPVKDAKKTAETEQKKEDKSTPKKEKVAADTPEKSGKGQKAKASPAAGKSEKKTEKKGKKSKA